MGERDQVSQHSGHADRSHEEARAALPEYATAMALGQAPEIHYPRLFAHLQSCPACRAELGELLDLVMPTYRGQLMPMAGPPQPDLSFLRAPEHQLAAPRRSWFVDQLQRFVVEFSEQIVMSMRQSAFAQAARGQAIYHYTPESPPDYLGITIDIFATDTDPALGNVQVLLDMPSRDPFDQSGTPVTLRVGARVWEGVTSATGSVTFTAVQLDQLAQLRVEVTLPLT